MYLKTDPGGVAYVLRRPVGQSAEGALDRLCDRLGGAQLTQAPPGPGGRKRKRGQHGGWSSSISFYGKREAKTNTTRKCAAPLVCPRMPAHMRLAPYRLPADDNDEDDAILKAAIEEAELAQTPTYRMRQTTIAFFRAHSRVPCPHVEQDYEHLGAEKPQPCKGTMTLKHTAGNLWFLGCSEYQNERGHRFKPVPPTVDRELLASFIANPPTADAADAAATADAPACLSMDSRWARRQTCPLGPQSGVDLIPSGEREDGSCPVRLTLYTFDRRALAQYTVIVLTGEHTHPRAIRAIPRGHLKSRVFDILEGDPTTTRAQIARTIREELDLRPNSAAIAHAHADFRLERNPLREDQVGVMARLAASQGGAQYVRKTVFGATGEGGT